MHKTENNNMPLLSNKQIELMSRFGIKEKHVAGTVLIEEGQKNYDFLVVLNGEVAILDPFVPEKLIAIHKERGFTGDSDMLSDRASIFKAIAYTDAEVIRISQVELKKILLEDGTLNEMLITAFLLRRENILKTEGGCIIIGSKYSAKSFEVRDFFTKNHLRHSWLDIENNVKARVILEYFNVSERDIPILISSSFEIIKNPSIEDIAFKFGVSSNIKNRIYQVMIVGTGPSGLAAGVYGASEGLDVIAIDKFGPGGQAGTTSKIENYLGFPTGISGNDLANKAYLQAQKFGCTISIPCVAEKLVKRQNFFELFLDNGSTIKAKTVIAATGAKYRHLNIPNIDYYKGRGIYYSATAMEASGCKKDDVVVIVGGGNSAGQAAIYLADYAKEVHLFIRGTSLTKSMSKYLIDRIENHLKIIIHVHTEILELYGERGLEEIRFMDNSNKIENRIFASHLFLFLGAVPVNDWLPKNVCLDSSGFIETGSDLSKEQLDRVQWPLSRRPYPLETCIPGLFAVGDLRSGSTKRVASSVGEGAMTISYVHNFLKV